MAALADAARHADLAEVSRQVGLSPSRAQRVVTEVSWPIADATPTR